MNSTMEETRYWMWTRRGVNGRRPLLSIGSGYDDSWEEQAFADDAAGLLGGCVWPPRSYSCSFCLREFRSAQALGGHMNVHRRDRARLKQSSTGEIDHHDTLSHTNQNPNPNPNPRDDVLPSPPSPKDHTMVVPLLSTTSRSLSSLELRLGRETCMLRGVDSTKDLVEDYIEPPSCKRQKIDPIAKPSLISHELLKFGSLPVEELDLELRLGNPAPKVK